MIDIVMRGMRNDRVETLFNHLKLYNLVSVEELVEVTGTSPSTIRRELSKLTRKGTISRVHGGAILNHYFILKSLFVSILTNLPSSSNSMQILIL